MFRLFIVSVLLYSAITQGSIEVPLDPTRPPANRASAAAAAPGETLRVPVLQEILMGARGSRAVIDGRTLRVGDAHADTRILAITPQSVLIERQGKREYLRLAKPVLQPSR